jgi:hypothetical protein
VSIVHTHSVSGVNLASGDIEGQIWDVHRGLDRIGWCACKSMDSVRRRKRDVRELFATLECELLDCRRVKDTDVDAKRGSSISVMTSQSGFWWVVAIVAAGACAGAAAPGGRLGRPSPLPLAGRLKCGFWQWLR